MPRHRLDVLMEKVSGGAVLLVTAGNTLMRNFEELSGIELCARYAQTKPASLQIDGSTITVIPYWSYKAENVTGEILAEDSAGNPLFVKHTYGKGTVYFLAAAPELELMNANAPFFRESSEDYYKLYALAGKDIIAKKNIVSGDRYINVSKHKLNENQSIVVAVNNDIKERSFTPILRDGYEISEFYCGSAECIEKNGAAVFKIVRK